MYKTVPVDKVSEVDQMHMLAPVIAEFYTVSALQAQWWSKWGHRHPSETVALRHHEALYDILLSGYTERLESHIARSLRDYLALICLGEARHARGQEQPVRLAISTSPKKSDLKLVPLPGNRQEVYRKSLFLEPDLMLQVSRYVFETCHWHGSFGGKAWAHIAKWGGRFGSMPHSVFIDHVLDLEHNTGSIFNKPTLWNGADLRGILNTKAAEDVLVSATWTDICRALLCPGHAITYGLWLWRMAHRLGFASKPPQKYTFVALNALDSFMGNVSKTLSLPEGFTELNIPLVHWREVRELKVLSPEEAQTCESFVQAPSSGGYSKLAGPHVTSM